MPHLVLEIARRTIERRMLALPVEENPDGTPADILAPPVPRQDTVPTAFGPVRYRFVIRVVALRSTVGTDRCTLALNFDEGSIEALSLDRAAGMLGGSITVPFQFGFTAEAGGPKGQVAELNADFSSTLVTFTFDASSRARIAAELGPMTPGMLEGALSARLTLEFRAMGATSAGMSFDLTPGVPSEELMTVDSLPTVVWVDAETLALSLRYGASPVPPSFQPVPFISGPTTIGLRLSNDGFQRTLRARAVRRIARDMLSDRIRDRFVCDGAVPLPLTHSPWLISVGYRSTEQYRFSVFPSTAQTLASGKLAVSAAVWRPEPPLKGKVETRQFSMGVQREGDDVFILDVPPESGCIVIAITTEVVDGSGYRWKVSHHVDVPNETVQFRDDFSEFTARCEGGRREWQLIETPSLLDRVWNPPDVYVKYVQEAIRTGQPGVTSQLDSIATSRGLDGLRELLAPSLNRSR
ncbi:hypothetical protein BH23GEM9_BH23GEM9_08620 [soil metagenome]